MNKNGHPLVKLQLLFDAFSTNVLISLLHLALEKKMIVLYALTI